MSSSRPLRLLAVVLAGGLLAGLVQDERRIDVMSSGGFTAAYQKLSPEFTRRAGIRLAPRSPPSRRWRS